ncbi:MAG: succinate dehydrogenase/fumarate reductase iron-sulfur subunit [Bdellovibrionota bacterium]
MNLKLVIWRQKNREDQGRFVEVEAHDISPDMSFLEMLDQVNEGLVKKGEEAIEFDSDCREGICGTCGLVINGQAHGPKRAVATCQLHMRSFHDGDTITIEPWRAAAFPVIKDLVVDRSAFDRIIGAGGYVSVKTSKHADANAILVPKPVADHAFEVATCIGCGACVAACPNASASLFTAAKIAHLSLLPQGKVEKDTRVKRMVEQMDLEGFGNCTNIGECRAACPKDICIDAIARMKRDYLVANLKPARQIVADEA